MRLRFADGRQFAVKTVRKEWKDAELMLQHDPIRRRSNRVSRAVIKRRQEPQDGEGNVVEEGDEDEDEE
jgi:hypothetical protein